MGACMKCSPRVHVVFFFLSQRRCLYRPATRLHCEYSTKSGFVKKMEPTCFLFDTHSHAHDDLAHLDAIPERKVDKIALMGTSQNDWGVVERLHRAKPGKVLAAS